MEYISHTGYKDMMNNFKKGTSKGLLKEGNAFTAGLAKAEQGEEFKVDGQSVKDTSDYDASVGEGLNFPTDQATGQTIVTTEEQAPYGFSVLSPDERNQLKEYIQHYKTIKSEISKLLEKAGKTGKIMEGAKEDEVVPASRPAHYNEPTKTPKHKPSKLGGDRTGLVMTKAEMWEGVERVEGLVNVKLKETFEKVTGLIMKDLMEEGFDEEDIKLYLDHIVEEKAKEAAMGQYDL